MNVEARIHPRRWQFLAVWCTLFTIVTVISLVQIRHDSATTTELKRTNCALRAFLVAARDARFKASQVDKNPADKKLDLQAVRGYGQIIKIFPARDCPKGVK